ncbi:MAG TPA: hypothetical protein VGF52_03610, partial [Tepidisphaeraceae bacterium]
RSGKPLIGDIIIYPPVSSFEGPVNFVTYKRLARDRQGRLWWLSKHMIARIPFKPTDPRQASGEANFTIEKFLSTLARQHDFIQFHYAWWLEPGKSLAVGAAAGVVVIGILWPMLLSLLTSGGLAPRRAASEKKSSLFSVRSSSTIATKSPPKVSAADEQRLHDLTAAYERNLPISDAPSTNSAAPAAAEPVRKLEGGPLEIAAQVKKEEDEIEVKGEYYPVLIHHKKPSDRK